MPYTALKSNVMKKEEEDFLIYDEDEAVAYILKFLPEDTRKRITKDEIDYILDVIYDFYEEKGYIEEDSAEEADIDEDEMFEYIQAAVIKDKMDITEDEIQLILHGEYEYGKSIGVYND